ncbi:MAG TPA: hypothetical protein PK156_20230 [Polyangium sp.]|nr:hypothetical protein [Polyangium sp.]
METRQKTVRSGLVRHAKWTRAALVASPLLFILGTFVSACGDEENGFRRGFSGDSCSRTDDCADPLRCVNNVCIEPTPTGGITINPDDFEKGPGPSASEGPWSQCDMCLEGNCAMAEKACGPDCVAIEACIETTCKHLSELGSDEESPCFIQCQNKYPGGKAQHVALVDCAFMTTCQPPCTFYPQDYDFCRGFMNNGDCYGIQKACDENVNCKNFRDCVSFCTTLQDCLACDDTAQGIEGRAYLEAYETCVARECLTESWIP